MAQSAFNTEDHVSAGQLATIGARIERLPGIPLSVPARIFLALLYFFAFYDITVVGVVLPTVAQRFHLGTGGLNLPVTLNLVGYVVGAYLFSTMADIIGRKRTLAVSMSVLSAGAILTAFAWDFISLSIFRGIVGIGTGSLIAIGATYAAEIVPARLRGRLVQFNMLMAGIGLGAAPWIARPLLGSHDGWRILLGLGTLAILAAALMRYLPESPRWLASHGRTEDADREMRGLEARYPGQTALLELPVVRTTLKPTETSRLPLLDLLRPPYLGRILVVVGFWLGTYFATYSVLGYEPILLSHLGLSLPDSEWFTAIGDSAFPIGALLTYLFIDRIDRRLSVAITVAVLLLSIVLFAIGAGRAMIIIASLLFSLAVVPEAGAGYSYTTEIFPTNARSSAMAMGDGFGHLGGVFAPTITLAALAAWGAHGTFWLLSGFLFIAFLIVMLGARRSTTGQELGVVDLELDVEPKVAERVVVPD